MLYIDNMRSIDPAFYKTKKWQTCRAKYISQHPLCEKCLELGIVNPSRYVHHKIFLNESNVHDTAIAYGDENLQALCYECHEREHERKKKRRFRVDPNGKVFPA